MNGNQLLQNKTIIVTGAATGIGQAFSLACAPHAFTVFNSKRYRKDADEKSWEAFLSFLDKKM